MEASAIGPTCSCCWGLVKDFSLYFWRKRRDALDLRENFDTLESQVNCLSTKWKELDGDIDRLSITVERTLEYQSVKESVSKIEGRFKAIDVRYQQLCCVKFRNQSPVDVERPRSRQKTAQMMWTCTLFAFARLHTKVGTLKADASRVIGDLKPTDLIRQVRPVVMEIPYAKEVDIDGHPHKQYLDSVLEHIDNEDCKTICIYRRVPAGVGVSNIMKNVNNYFLKPSSPFSICKSRFACVIWVAIQKQETREKTIESIQKEILYRVSAPSGETVQQKSDIITSVLGSKKCLLLLDDFPANIKLEDIGIPEGKVVMTTTDIHRLRIIQELDAEIEVKKLLPDESIYMFQKIFFERREQKMLSKLERDEVELILRDTDGILSFIKVAAIKLDNPRNLEYWQGVRQGLQSGDEHGHFLETAGVINLYKQLYEELKEVWKKCLLFVALYPNEYLIPRNYLTECWKAQSLLPNNPGLKAMRADGEFVCVTLEQKGLLERPCVNNVKMPQIFRKFALSLTYPDQGSGSAEAALVRFHPEDVRVRKPWSKNANWICGAQTNLENIPAVTEIYGFLWALLLQKNSQLICVEIAFFTSIPNILVLDMHGTGIKLLPTSISSLTKLRCLYLNGCRSLETLPGEMVHLTGLEVFDIRKTQIHCKPTQPKMLEVKGIQYSLFNIGVLTSLKCLRVSFEKEDAIWETPTRLWSCSLEELGIEFSKGVEKNIFDHVEQELKDGFRDSDIKIYLDSEFEQKELNLGKVSLESEFGSKELILEKKLEQAAYSPSTSGLKSNNYQELDPAESSTGSIQLADRKVFQRGKEIVEEVNGKLQEGVSRSMMKNSGTGSKQFSDKGKEIVEDGMTSGLKMESDGKNCTGRKEIVEEETYGNPEKGLGNGLKKDNDQPRLKKPSVLRQVLSGFQKEKLSRR